MVETENIVTASEAARMLGLQPSHFHTFVKGREDAPGSRTILGRRAYDLHEFVAWARKNRYLLTRDMLPRMVDLRQETFDRLVESAGEPPHVEIDGERLYGLWSLRRWVRRASGLPADLRRRRDKLPE